MATTHDTHDYDPRYDRAQTIAGAKARYVTDDLPAYDEAALERDVDRLLTEGDTPDVTAADRAEASLLAGGERVST